MKKIKIKDLVGSSYHSIKLFDSDVWNNPDKRQPAIAEFRFEGSRVNILMQNPRRMMRIAMMDLDKFRDLFKGVL